MIKRLLSRILVLWLLIGLGINGGSYAQSLRQVLINSFDEVLLPTSQGGKLVLSGFGHGLHFIPASVSASDVTINAFSNFLSANISSFPLSSTTSGLTFDFSSGMPVSTSTSLGPIFTERSQTIGQGSLKFGINFSYLKLNKLRGVNTEDIWFTFFHDDFAGPNDIPGNFTPNGVIGDDPFGTEFDHIRMNMNLRINATIMAFFGTFGITDRLDISIAVPYVNVTLEGNPIARMNPLTILSSGARGDTVAATPTHYWGSLDDPQIEFVPTAINDEAVGIGDIAIRLKYNFWRSEDLDMAVLAEYRAATGDEEDFLGAGESSYRLHFIMSTILGDFAPHINLGYEKRGNKYDRDELEVYLGYDQKIADRLTFALDFMGEFEVGSLEENLNFPEPIAIQGGGANGEWSNYKQVVQLTNIPNMSSDNSLNGSVGFKYHPKENLIAVINGLFPLNEGGLRSDFVPTIGFEFTF
jgi:hypothetical protein